MNTPLTIALVQTELEWEQPSVNLARFEKMLGGIEADLVVLPEMFSTGFSMASGRLAESMDGPTVTWMRDQARLRNTIICGSFIAVDACPDGDQHFNRLVWMRPDGTCAVYDKRHLFRMSGEHEHYSSGDSRLVVEACGFRICPLICYDLRFPVWSRGADAFDLMLYIANWPAVRDHHWRSLLTARAIENQAYVIGVNRLGTDGNNLTFCGSSLVADFNGNIDEDMGRKAGVAIVQITRTPLDEYRQAFPAHLDADNFELPGTRL